MKNVESVEQVASVEVELWWLYRDVEGWARDGEAGGFCQDMTERKNNLRFRKTASFQCPGSIIKVDRGRGGANDGGRQQKWSQTVKVERTDSEGSVAVQVGWIIRKWGWWWGVEAQTKGRVGSLNLIDLFREGWRYLPHDDNGGWTITISWLHKCLSWNGKVSLISLQFSFANSVGYIAIFDKFWQAIYLQTLVKYRFMYTVFRKSV